MLLKNIVRKNVYYDSATLMLLSSKIGSNVAGISCVAVMMATDMNKELMKAQKLLTDEGLSAGPSDLIFSLRAENEADILEAMRFSDEMLNSRAQNSDGETGTFVKSTDAALKNYPNAALAVVSLPGIYAYREVRKLLMANKHVLLFSDNVSIEEEVELKDLALERGLLMMGPDCGTAIINGVGLGFSNKVKRGPVGIVAASGTGLQETARLISNNGVGISQAFGTGGRDVKEAVGGRMLLHMLSLLESDDETKVVVIVSKPPAPSVMEKVSQYVKTMKKPVIACFLGGNPDDFNAEQAYFVKTLEEAAVKAVELCGGKKLNFDLELDDDGFAMIAQHLKPTQKYIRGLYCGGTLAYESMLVMKDYFDKVYSNIALSDGEKLKNAHESIENTVVDLGDDEFTVGRPHPMIDPELRKDRLITEALDPEVAVILLDVELGYGSHDNPAGILAKQVEIAQGLLVEQNREVVFVASICGTYDDVQGYDEQKMILEERGIVVMDSNSKAARFATAIVSNIQ